MNKLTTLLLCLTLAASFTVNGQRKIDSTLSYAWPDSGPKEEWQVTYGYRDTVLIRPGFIYMDSLTRVEIVPKYEVLFIFPPPPYCRCMSQITFDQILDKDKKKIVNSMRLKTFN